MVLYKICQYYLLIKNVDKEIRAPKIISRDFRKQLAFACSQILFPFHVALSEFDFYT